MNVLSTSHAAALLENLTTSLEDKEFLPTDELIQYLRHPEGAVRRIAVDLLDLKSDSEGIPALLDAAADHDEEISIAATEAIRSIRPHEALKFLLEGLNHPAAAARLAAIVALRGFHAREAIEPLILALGDIEPTVRREAVISLARYQNPDLVVALRSAARDESPLVRRVALEVVVNFKSAFIFGDLISALDDEDWRVREQAVRGLQRFPGQDSRAALLDTLQDPVWQVVREAARGLAAQRAKADHRLLPLLRHAQPSVRATAAAVIGNGGNAAFRAHLEPLLDDSNDLVQEAARHASILLAD